MVKNNEANIKQTTLDHSRVTNMSKMLIMSRLHELPQIFNVLFGDMSIVGPRPHTVPMNIEFAKEIYNFKDRYRVNPGLTGLAQPKGFRGEIINFQELYARYRLDCFYVKKWCLNFDLKIIIETAYSLITKNQKAY